jgi:hypothetical protein
MQIKCVNKKTSFKNLTTNKDYEAIEDGEVYVVTNDAGFRARYAKTYFRAIPAAPVTRNLLDVLEVSLDDETLTITLNRTTRTVNISSGRTDSSCGVIDTTGIANIKATVTEMYNAKVPTIIGTKAEMFRAVMEEVMNTLRNDDEGMCYLISDQIKASEEDMDAILTEMADITTSGHNPNSDHEIRLWVIK